METTDQAGQLIWDGASSRDIMIPAFHRLWPPGDNDELSEQRLTQLYVPAVDPWLRVNFVASADGAATVDDVSTPLSGPPDKAVFAVLRDHCDAVIVGAQTFRHEQYRPPATGPRRQARRIANGRAVLPRLVIISSSLDLDLAVPAWSSSAAVPLVITHHGSDPARRAALAGQAEVECIGEHTVDLPATIKWLHQHGLTQLLCEGGPRLFAELAAAGLVNELCLTLSPQLVLGDGPRIVAGSGSDPTPPRQLRQLRLTQLLHADSVLLARYRLVNDPPKAQ